MKGILSKRWFLCAVFGLMLYVSALALTALLILRGVLKEELVTRGCTMSAFTAGFLSALAYRLSRKDAFFAILLGVVICAIIMSLASYGVIGFLSFLI